MSGLQVHLSEETRRRLREVAESSHKSEAEIAAALIEGSLAAEDLEIEIIRRRLQKARAGGPSIRHDQVLAWLSALAEGKREPPPSP